MINWGIQKSSGDDKEKEKRNEKISTICQK